MQPLNIPSNARAYFDHIKNQAAPFSFLSDIPASPNTSPFFEEEWLDFKGNPQDDKDAKRIWSKALSGYANITDGLIVWGIDARKTPPRDIDAACGLRLIPDPKAFESKLRDWIRDATNPPVMNVEYASYVGPNDYGFVVCLIPQSNHKPHRAEFADKQYYFRAGDDFLPAEPGLLRTLFYPEIHPSLAIEATLRYLLSPGALAIEYLKSPQVNELRIPGMQPLSRKGAAGLLANSLGTVEIEVRLYNTGKISAKDVYAVLKTEETHPRIDAGEEWARGTPIWGTAAFNAMRVFHPGEAIRLFTMGIERKFSSKAIDDKVIPIFDKIQFQVELYAENYQGQPSVVSFVPDDVSLETYIATKEAWVVG